MCSGRVPRAAGQGARRGPGRTAERVGTVPGRAPIRQPRSLRLEGGPLRLDLRRVCRRADPGHAARPAKRLAGVPRDPLARRRRAPRDHAHPRCAGHGARPGAHRLERGRGPHRRGPRALRRGKSCQRSTRPSHHSQRQRAAPRARDGRRLDQGGARGAAPRVQAHRRRAAAAPPRHPHGAERGPSRRWRARARGEGRARGHDGQYPGVGAARPRSIEKALEKQPGAGRPFTSAPPLFRYQTRRCQHRRRSRSASRRLARDHVLRVPALRSFGHPAAADLGASPILFRCGSRTTCARGCPPTRPRSGRAGRPPNVHAFFFVSFMPC